MVFEGDSRDVGQIIKQDNLEIQHLSEEEHISAAKRLIEANPEIADKVRKGQKGKLQWFVGQLIRQGGNKVDAEKAVAVLRPLLLP